MSTIKSTSNLTIANSVNSSDAITKGEVNTIASTKMPISGGTFTGPINLAVSALPVVSSHASLNCNLANIFSLSVTVPTILDNPTNQVSGSVYYLIIKNTGNTTLDLSASSYLFEGGILPTITARVNAIDVVKMVCDPFDTTKMLCVFIADIKHFTPTTTTTTTTHP